MHNAGSDLIMLTKYAVISKHFCHSLTDVKQPLEGLETVILVATLDSTYVNTQSSVGISFMGFINLTFQNESMTGNFCLERGRREYVDTSALDDESGCVHLHSTL